VYLSIISDKSEIKAATCKWQKINVVSVLSHLRISDSYALYSSPNTNRVFKPRRLRWAGHVARMGERRGAYRVLVGKPD
jgi:hypothetical protein